MLRLRKSVMAVGMGIGMGMGMMGCTFSTSNIAHYSIWHCDECDDFPTPAYGPGYSMVPGTYTGPTARDSATANQPSTATPNSGSAPPPRQQPDGAAPPTTITPPTPPAATPTDTLPSVPGADRNNLPNPATNP
jgi:hypothetical protein